MVTLKVHRLDQDIPLPHYAHHGDAGMDICSSIDYKLKAGELKLIPTGLSVSIPFGYELQVRPRSGLSTKKLTIPNSPGTIDHQYRGELKVIMLNLGDEPYFIQRGERIAQIVLKKVEMIEMEEVEELDDTERGDGSFGHSGRF